MYIDKFIRFIKDNNLFHYDDKILLAVSGGRDSAVMSYLFKALKLNFAIAHCNFMLREEDSLKDEEFVEKLAAEYQVPFFTKRFQTIEYAKEYRISIQEAARKLRYTWFLYLLDKYSYKYVATAHHKNDLVETMLINILRHTGLYGLKGFLPKNNKIIRPLLSFDSNELNQLVELNNIPFREDKSNNSDKYLRNRIRKYIIPNFNKVDENFIEAFVGTSRNLYDQEIILKNYIDTQKLQLLRNYENYQYIEISDLKNTIDYNLILYEILKPFGINRTILDNLIQSLNHNETREFKIDKYDIIKSRSKIIIKQQDLTYKDVDINPKDYISLRKIDLTPDLLNKIYKNSNPNIAYLDANKLTGNVQLRYWQNADRMTPLGMRKQKNISDILTDRKVNLISKQKTMVLTYNADIIWLVGHVISDKYKILRNTQHIIEIEFNDN